MKIDEVGNKYGKLVVIQEIIDSRKGAHWLCKCDCGRFRIAKGISLRSNGIKSCGCLHELNPGEAAFNKLLYNYKFHAEERNLVWNLADEFFGELTKQECYYCGTPPSQEITVSNNGSYMYNGIDRINNDIGYEPDNVVPCCGDCNFRKGAKSHDEFIEWAFRIAIRHME